MRIGVVMLLLAAHPALAAKSASGKRAAEEQTARGDAWTVAGRCDEAVKAYRKAVALDPKNGLVEVRLAHCLAKTGGDAEADQLLARLADSPPPIGPAALTERGDLAMSKNDFRAAVEIYDRLLAKLPASVEARAALLDALKGLADSGDAAAKARALELAGRLKTETRADRTTQRHAEELESILRYGDAGRDLLDGRDRLAKGDAKGAAAALERITSAHPDVEEAFYLLGTAYAAPELSRKPDARTAWRKAPHVKEALLALGVDAYESDDIDEALKRLTAAVALDDRYQAAHYQLGLIHRERGKMDEARRAWQRAASIDPSSELGKWANTKLQLASGHILSLSEGQVIDPSSEVELGQNIGKQVAERFGTIDDTQLAERLEAILKKLTQVSDRSDREMRYRVQLIDVPMINALTLPGGTILVFRGLIDMVKTKMGNTDDAWASVLGHECAHAALRHGMGMIQVASSLLGGKAAFAGGPGDLSALINTVSRAHEFEADQFGALYSYRAGYNPAESITLHQVMLGAMGEIPRGMTHPTHAERIARVRDYLLDLRAKVHGFDLGVKALGTSDYDRAISHFEVFLGVFPESTSARSNLGVAMHRKALTALEPSSRFRRATDVDPNARAKKIELRAGAVDLPGLKAPPKIDERLLREAAAEYQSVLAIDPTYARAQVNLGAALDDLKDRRGARAALEKAVRMAPASKEAWNNLGAVAAETGDTARALEALKKAVELDGGYADAWFNLAMTYEQANKQKDAASAWDKYVALDAKSGWTEIARTHRARFH